jgi:hypothetical protein
MTTINLSTPIVIVPASEAVTTSTVSITHVAEHYGWDYDPTQPGMMRGGPGKPQSVEATVVLSTDPYQERRITVWEGDAYVAVRGTWTDADLATEVATILSQN